MEILPGEVFAKTEDFDGSIRQLLPKYEEVLDVIVSLVPPGVEQILELGCGTGELSLKLLNRYPKVKIVALDYSERMITYAQTKIVDKGYSDRWKGVQLDFGVWANEEESQALGSGFDACVSSLAIHHLTDEMKQKLFERISKTLKPGGVFWNGDPVLVEFPLIQEVYQKIREDWATQQGTTITEVRAKLGTTKPYGYSSQDQLATLETHLQMLKTAGFTSVAVPWKYYGMAVFGGMISIMDN
ncbi:Methyltransferase type 12 [Gloeothece citriformis PCC 7424]|uniref:Methyltransferase type 12 n=1 Tax=Gloeothece citriformis (strain PCC 7424) TaxID=65393 RepID=B7K7B1_GLOC7|nr:class I SAM-dependent methyltransferase [Gloeothece citriformis]ACK69679.1 Methyltransferase type 12 [Gloeothece citriformis PCC 7424]